MSAIRRLGSGRIASLFNGGWVVALAVLIGVGGPLVLALRASRPNGNLDGISFGWFSSSGDSTSRSNQGGLSEQDAKLVSDGELSQRMQLTVALAMAASLRLRFVQVERGLPVDTGSLYQGMAKELVNGKTIIPKGFSGPLQGSSNEAVIMRAGSGLYLLRYLPRDGGIVEVISVSSDSGSGQPAMMARLPDDKRIFGEGVGFYTRYELSTDAPDKRDGFQSVLVPAFVDSTRMVGAGWRIVKLSFPMGGRGSK